MLKLEHVKKQYLDVLFDDVTFVLGNREKVGLVGLNGCGKTTLFKIIAGIERPDAGSVEVVNEVIGYLPQEFSFPKDQLVGEFLENLVRDPHTELFKIDKILQKLNMFPIDHYQSIDSLSEGQEMKLKLAELLSKESTVLLLDEPTNHLDIAGILWFEEFIKNFEGICIVISHDRDFLNNTVDKVFEIDEQRLYVFEGNYDDYIEGKEKFKQLRQKAYVHQEKKREQLEALITGARKIKGGVKRGKQVRAAKKRMEREVLKKEIKEYEDVKMQDFKLEGFVHKKKKVFETKDISFAYDKDKKIFRKSGFSMHGNERVWFYGANGIGKTTFIKLLTEELNPEAGEVNWGANISWTYFSQDQAHLDMEATVAEYFDKNTNVSFDRSFGILEGFLFPKELRNYKLKTLSPGQRARLSFAAFAQGSYDFLILDEPTNHLDIRTKEVIENSLLQFEGAILLISHDRYFVKRIGVNRVVTIKDGKIVEK